MEVLTVSTDLARPDESVALLTLRVDETEAEIDSATQIFSSNGLSAQTNITQRVTTAENDIGDVEDDVDGLKSEVVLKAEVTSGGITKLAAVQLNASVGGGAMATRRNVSRP